MAGQDAGGGSIPGIYIYIRYGSTNTDPYRIDPYIRSRRLTASIPGLPRDPEAVGEEASDPEPYRRHPLLYGSVYTDPYTDPYLTVDPCLEGSG